MLTVQKLLSIYRQYPALYADSKNGATFEWINRNDSWANTISYIRRNPWDYKDALVVLCNFSPMHHESYVCGVPMGGDYTRIFSTYDTLPGGGGPDEVGGEPVLTATEEECDGRPYRLTYSLRPFEAVIIRFPEQ
jgi:1,4-alpha-glucan branching enzyme